MPARKPKSSKKSKTTAKRSWYLKPLALKLYLVFAVCSVAWLIYLDAQVRYKFEGKRWALPAQVYARALEIYDGRALNLNNLEQELALLRYRKRDDASSPGSYQVTGRQVTIYARAHHLPEGEQPAAQFRFELKDDVVQQLSPLAGPQKTLYSLDPFKIGGIYPQSKEERLLLSYTALPPQLVQALLVTEDRSFYSHWGIAPSAILRAMWKNFRAQRVVQGGSTLTQQLVKNFYLSRERSLWRKVNEALMSLMLESHYDKAAILETYANDIYLGQSGATAVHGFGMASMFYFAKPLEHSTVEELALLVALVKGPSYYDPRRHPERAKERRDLVLSLMRDEGMLSPDDYRQAQARPLGVVDKPRIQTNRYPAFMQLVRRQLAADYNEQDLRTEGLKIYTTLDPQLQQNLELASQEVMNRLSVRNGDTLQTGAVVTGVGTGEVLALIGDRQPRYRGFNRALDARRAIGSLIKPAVYLTALMQPENYSLASLLSDQAFRIEFTNGDEWEPRNFDQKSHGEVPLIAALSRSLNISTARLGLDIGVDSVQDTLEKLGVTGETNPYPSLLLGAQSLSPFEVSKFYQTIASNGFNMPLRAIREVSTADGMVLSRYPFDVEQVVPPEAVFLLQHAMQETMRTGTGRYAYQRLPAALNLAGKTGTTNDNRDSWFAGFSGDYLGVVWVGMDDNSATLLTGSSGALRLWTDFMARIPQYPLAMVKPSQIQYQWFDRDSWALTDEQCRDAQPIPVWGTAPNVSYEACSDGFSSWKGWLKSWF